MEKKMKSFQQHWLSTSKVTKAASSDDPKGDIKEDTFIECDTHVAMHSAITGNLSQLSITGYLHYSVSTTISGLLSMKPISSGTEVLNQRSIVLYPEWPILLDYYSRKLAL
eukprot:8892307-Ditylum_brightwellii.AAC.1